MSSVPLLDANYNFNNNNNQSVIQQQHQQISHNLNKTGYQDHKFNKATTSTTVAPVKIENTPLTKSTSLNNNFKTGDFTNINLNQNPFNSEIFGKFFSPLLNLKQQPQQKEVVQTPTGVKQQSNLHSGVMPPAPTGVASSSASTANSRYINGLPGVSAIDYEKLFNQQHLQQQVHQQQQQQIHNGKTGRTPPNKNNNGLLQQFKMPPLGTIPTNIQHHQQPQQQHQQVTNQRFNNVTKNVTQQKSTPVRSKTNGDGEYQVILSSYNKINYGNINFSLYDMKPFILPMTMPMKF